MKLSFIRDDVVKVYHQCKDINILKHILLDMRNEIIRLRLIIENLKKEKT